MPFAGGDQRWPVLDGGPAAVTLDADRTWRHDGYRMHVVGRGPRVEAVHAWTTVMEQIRHDPGDSLVLHADRTESLRGGDLHHRWATALELPLFFWERSGAGEVSWVSPLPAPAVELDAEGARLVLRSEASDARVVFEVQAGELALAENGRIAWHADGPSRLVAIAATGEADLERSLDLLSRRTIGGLGRQRVQHAEQLQRGGAAMRAAGIASLAEVFDWAKVRGDALLGASLAGGESVGDGLTLGQSRLAEGMLAAGLSHLPRALGRRDASAVDFHGSGHAPLLAAWIGESQDTSHPQSPTGQDRGGIANQGRDDIAIPAVEEIAAGQVDSDGVGSFLAGAVASLWGVVPDALRDTVTLAPDVTRLGAVAALSRLRVGRTVLDVRLRSRGEIVSIGVRRGAGPPIVVDCCLPGVPVAEVIVDGEAMAGSRARFEVREACDVEFHLGAEPPLSSAPS